MTGEPTGARQHWEQTIAELAKLRQFAGPPGQFWPRYLATVHQLTAADQLALLVRAPGQPWRRVMDWPRDAAPSRLLSTFVSQLEDFGSRTSKAGGLVTPLEPKDGPGASNFVIGATLNLQQQEESVLVAVISEISEAAARERAMRLTLAAEVAVSYQRDQLGRQAKADVEKLSAVLDLSLSVTGQEKFMPSAIAVCNGLATRFNCDRVSLGWIERGFVRLRAISRTEQFDRQMAAAQALETAMEEAADQDEEIVWPVLPGTSTVTRDHERFVQEQKVGNICSIPLRRGDEVIAVLTCERQSAAFTETEVQQLRLTADVAGPRLADLKDRDRWFGARWVSGVRRSAAKYIGPEHTWAKIVAAAIVVGLALLVFLRVPYRVEGNFILRSDQLAYLAAPFDGYIDQASVRPGDIVKPGDVLLKLKTAELELEESSALADLNRYLREAEKSRAAKALAEMRIAEALANQASARLELVRHRVQQATIRSPFAGVVIEGDLRERLGSPVKTADVLLKVAQIETLYVEAEIHERDVHEILGKTDGEIAFVTQPKQSFPIRIETIEQAAVPKPDGSVFLVRCRIEQGAESWWRPGMSGVCKITAGKRTLWWILTHRTVDFLRLKLWW